MINVDERINLPKCPKDYPQCKTCMCGEDCPEFPEEEKTRLMVEMCC